MSIAGSEPSSADRLRREIVARRLAGLATARSARIPQVDRGGVLPVSFAQERLWFLEAMSERGDEYLLWFSWRVRGGLDQAAWQGALDDVVARHEVLRTALAESGGLPVQRVAAAVSVPLRWCQVPAADARERLAGACAAAGEFARQRFDLASAPLVRAGVWVLDPQDAVAVVAFHHIATDGWSGRIFLRELTEFYQGRLAGTPAVLAPLPVQYGDFAVWQRQWLSGGVLQEQLAYWRGALSGVRVLELPADRARPPVRSGRGGGVQLTFPAGLVTSLEELGRRHGATLFMVLLAAFQVVLGRWSGQEDFAVGTPAAGRSRLELEDLIGFFVNTLVIRGDLSANPTFAEFLGRVRESVLGAFDHQEVPFERLVEELRPERDLSRNPLFQAWLALQNFAPADEFEGPDGFEYLKLESDEGTAPFDISLVAYPDPAGDGMVGRFTYDSDLFDEAPVVRLAGHVRRVLETAAADPGARVWEIGLVSPEERSGLLDPAGPDAGTDGPEVLPLVCALPAAAGTALACGDQVVSYPELETMISGLSAGLTARGATRGTRIGVCLRRGTWSVAAMLATWRAGATYIPLDPAFPPERLRHMITEAAITLTITDTTTTPLATALGTQPIPADTTGPPPAPAAGTPPHPRDLAYIIFTSGTTGPPKPVGIEHAALARHITAAAGYYNITPADRVLAFASHSFDASLEQILPALATGAQLILRPDEHWLPDQLPRIISRHQLTVANLPPAYWAELVSCLTPQTAAQLATLRLLILGGDIVPAHRLPAWTALAPHITLINAYGPTETVITATTCDITRAPGDRSTPIGRPLPGRRVYIADPRGQLLPPGVPGELLIGGPALARGYLGHPARTAQKFTPDPHSADGTRLYHTGDLARWLPDGNLEYLGRTDNQIKLRGFRIEPGEIEAVMSRCPGVAAAATAIRADRHGGQILVGYFVSQSADQVRVSVLREWCARYLPEYARPSQVVRLAVLPVTAGGKLDRAALPEVTPDGAAVKAEYVAPRDETERMIAQIWTEVLGVDQVGIDDDFFDLGGHSLLAGMAVSRIAARLGRDVQLRALFENPRIRDLGPVVTAARRTVTASVVPVDRGGVLPVSFAQERLWFLEAMSERGDEYLLWFSWRVRGGLDQAAWQGALDDVVARHEVLRTALAESGGLPVQRVAAAVSVPLRWCQVPAADARERLAGACAAAGEFARQRFDLASAPLVRAGVWVLDPQDAVAVVAFHHIATDGWSGRIFLRELTEFYQGRLAGTPAVLAPLPVQYGDFAVWQRQWLSGGVLQEQLAYWRGALSGVRVLELPADRARPPVRSGRGGGVQLTFPAGLVTSLEELGRRHGATLFMVLLAAFQVVLGRWSGQEDFAVGTPAAGRSRLELEDLIGFFVNTLVIRGDLSANPTFAEFLHRVRESVLGAFDHQEVPFERLVEELRPERDLSRNPLFQVMFDLQEGATPAPPIAELEFESVLLPWEVAKFDLTANFLVTDSRFALEIEYDSDLFDEAPVVRLAGHVRRVLETAAADPGARVWEIGLVSPEERSGLLDLAGPDAGTDGPEVLPLVCALPAAAGTAVACGDQVVSYPELETMVSGLSAGLTARGATRGSRIGVCLRRGTWSVAAMLATWRTGGTYIPLDPAFPPERLRHMITEAAITLTITDTTTTPLATALGTQPIPADTTGPPPAPAAGTPPHPRDLAYIIFTSGTTGPPKPVGIEHAALARHIPAAAGYYNITPADRVLAFASHSFDASLEQILPALAAGAQLILRPDEHWPAETLAAQVRARNVTVMELTPSYLAELTTRLDTLTTDLATLRLLVTGGEILPPAITRAWFEHLPGVQITNTYGPTEAAISATACCLTAPVTSRSVPIGRPLPGRRVYIADPRGQLVPPGVPGELLIGGPALARGYLGHPARTAEKFTPDPHSADGTRLYHTGDLARWLPDGNLEYLGRTDNQIKLRGFRIEPGEIEAALRAFPGARGAAVLVRKIHGEPSLIGYVAGSGLETKALEAWCRRFLPDYMVPVVLTVLDALPLTVQGKVDSGALPAPELLAATEYVAPQSPTEVVIAQIWMELLGVSQVGLRDNFFALGGHSLRAVSATSRLRAAFGCPIDVRHLFENPTVEDLSAEVERLLIEQISAMSEDDIGLSLMADPLNEGPGWRES